MNRLAPIGKVEKRALEKAQKDREWAEQRFPLIFGLLAAFGLVSTYYGFEKLIDNVELFTNNPWILLGVGVLTLLATGAAYRKLN